LDDIFENTPEREELERYSYGAGEEATKVAPAYSRKK
jgi:hypothetical protein